MQIEVLNHQKKIPLNLKQIKTIITAILKSERIPAANLSFVFVTRQKITALNKKFLHRNHATDVLAFDLYEENFPVQRPRRRRVNFLAGDIVISVDAALKAAKEYKTTPQRELALYMVHGVLHLRGYDDHSARKRKVMRKKEEELLGRLGKTITRISR